MFIKPPLRISDCWGQGHFGAPRGSRTHKGIDFAIGAGEGVFSHISGAVTKVGYPYGDDLSFRYVQVTSEATFKHDGRIITDTVAHRFFYVEPCLEVGDTVEIGTMIGRCQDSQKRYPAGNGKPEPITNHVHYEVKYGDIYLNPAQFLV